MKLFPQPITSPNRVEKYSPTLIRSIRSGNGRSKSRRRSSSSSSSRLSPMFPIRTTKRNKGRNETQTTLEPSSPKVNCCGEITVKRSSSNQITNNRIVKAHNHNWIQKVLFCKCSSIAKTKKKCRPVWGEWLVCLQIGKRVKEIVEDDNIESGKEVEEDKTEEFQDSHDDKEEEISEPAWGSVSTSPPKNALLLVRSRSESYYRPTSLAHLFWGSNNQEEDDDEVTEQNVNPRLSKDTKFEEKLGVSEENDCPTDRVEDELKKMRKGFDQYSPRELRRSKSDPPRISEELINDCENSMWKRRRFGFEEEEEHS